MKSTRFTLGPRKDWMWPRACSRRPPPATPELLNRRSLGFFDTSRGLRFLLVASSRMRAAVTKADNPCQLAAMACQALQGLHLQRMDRQHRLLSAAPRVLDISFVRHAAERRDLKPSLLKT